MMQKRFTTPALCLGLALTAGVLSIPAATFARVHRAAGGTGATLTLDATRTGPRISPTLFGLMFEDINHSGDGGIYAELIQNRSFLDDPATPVDWSIVASGRAQGSIDLDTRDPVNTTALTTSLRLTITRVGAGERIGVANDGYNGIAVTPHTDYHASFYARSSASFRGPLTVSLQSTGGTVYAAATVPAVATTWTHYSVILTTPSGIRPSESNRFVITAAHRGTVWFSLVSLFPPTWHNRPNGMRMDLMSLLSAMHPSFLRFPGGNYLEGQTVATRFEWKNTIGPLSLRPGHPDDAWGYRSTDGLGLLEYLEWCEDLHLTPVLAVYAGYSLDKEYVPAGPKLRPYVQDALDEIQYATGSLTTKWGARRAADGHPAPFTLPYVEVGNEDFFDNSGSYDDRFTQFYDAIKKAYPAIKVIATTDTFTQHADVVDEHYYMTPEWFAQNAHYYDDYNRNGPKIFVGEYAAQVGDIAHGQPTLGAALGEAAWMTGLERNSDVVIMASYAPLFQNENVFQWTPDLISYDSLNSYGSPSYYVQKLFGVNRGDVVVPSTLAGSDSLFSVASKVSSNGTMYLIVVNMGPSAQSTHIAIRGASVAPQGTATVLTAGSTDAMNSLSAPRTVAPTTQQVRGLGRSFIYTFRPYSLTVLRLASRPSADLTP